MIAALHLRKFAQALLLALAAWVLTAGVASAHGGHVGSDARPAAEAVAPTTDVRREGPAASAAGFEEKTEAVAGHDEGSCPTGAPAKHSGNCCNIACHASMPASAFDLWVGIFAASAPVPGLSDMLEGRSGDRSERPPRLV